MRDRKNSPPPSPPRPTSADIESRVAERTRDLEAARAELEAKSRQIEEVDRLKNAFIANMSHEIRTPLNSVLALTQLLREGVAGPLTVDQRKYLQVIERNGHGLLHLINDVLDLSRIEAGHLEMDTEDLDLAPHVESVVEALAPLAAGKNLDLTVHLPPELPAARGDPDRFRQILTNLIGNAIKFTESGGQVMIGAEARPETIVVVVTDTGVGIPDRHRDKIFQEFYQVDQTLVRRQGGTGLGLAIARRLARLMGGDITVESVVSRGSRFSITLPRASGAHAAARPRRAGRGSRRQTLAPAIPPALALGFAGCRARGAGPAGDRARRRGQRGQPLHPPPDLGAAAAGDRDGDERAPGDRALPPAAAARSGDHGRADAGDDRAAGDRRDPGAAGRRRHPDRRAHRAGDEGRSRADPRRRVRRLPRQARATERAHFGRRQALAPRRFGCDDFPARGASRRAFSRQVDS